MARVKDPSVHPKHTMQSSSLPLMFPKDLLTEGKEDFFAPFAIPIERRLQTLVIVLWLLALPLCIFGTLSVVAVLTVLWWYVSPVFSSVGVALAFGYLTSFFFYRPYQKKGVKWMAWIKSRVFVKASNLFCGYFPATVVLDGLSPAEAASGDFIEKNFFRRGERYLCCYHPHGLFGLGAWSTFVANPDDFEGGSRRGLREVFVTRRLFRVTVHTLGMNFYIPWWREWLLLMGFCDVEKATLLRCLSAPESNASQERGHISVLVPGGAAESVYCSQPGVLALKNRKGFIKIALETGCHLVPVYCFGETKLYKPLTKNRKVLSLLSRVQKLLRFGTPLVCGRGIFNYGFGFLPHRERLTTVIGAPIPVKKVAHVTSEAVDKLHGEYVEALKSLYRRYQPLYDPNGPSELQLENA